MKERANSSSAGPLVSVIVPALNYAQFIGETLDCLRAQDYPAWECIVIDDGSTDDTAAVVKQWCERDARIQYAHQPNRGQAAARNRGLSCARGEYVQLLDADDLIEPHKLAHQVAFLETNAQVDIVYGDAQFFPTDQPNQRRRSLDEAGHEWMPRASGQGSEIAAMLIEKNIMVINSPLVRRRVFDEVGPFDESLPRADDWDMWLRCGLAGMRFEYRAEPGTAALVRVHPTSLTQRDRRLLASSVAIRRKVSQLTTAPQIRQQNDEMIRWLERVLRFVSRLDQVIPPECAFVLVDDDRIRPELRGYRAIPFTDRHGLYNGPPATGVEALAELDRLRRERGAAFIVFTWMSMWYLDCYRELHDHLKANFPRLCCDSELVIYDLRSQYPPPGPRPIA